MRFLTIITKYCLPAIIALFGLNAAATGQNNSFKIKGEILDSNGVGISDCYIKVTGIKSRIIYNYSNAGHDNTFLLEIIHNDEDSLAVTISCVGYEDTVIHCATNSKLVFLPVILTIKYHTLNGVVIKTPPVWHRGDTTFYNVNSFADGNERKLKDILEKMPGFEISADGQLRYKRKIINKIMVDGEELFSDKIALMLNNFPVHVLKNIQAIENQSNNKLLKGLTGDGNTVLNLGLNKDKQKAIFGDGEAGLGTEKKYSISPVIFSLLGKVKGGFIGNWNNIGNGIDWRQMYELKNEPERLAENWLKNNISAQIIPEFENRWYINNGQKDNRLQINFPISKSLKSKTEINYFKDGQRQNNYNASSFYNGSNFYLRNDSNEVSNKPAYLKLRETLTWSIDSVRELKLVNEYFNDNSSSNQNTVYTQNGSISYLNSSIANNWRSFTSGAELTHRVSVTKANQSSVEINQQSQSQTTVGLSPNWPGIYNLTNNEYVAQYQTAANKVTTLKAGITQFRKIGKSTVEMGVTYQWITAFLQDSVFVNNVKGSLPVVALAELNNNGKYTVHKIEGYYKRKYTFIHKNSVSLEVKSGISNALLNERHQKKSIFIPEYDLKIGYIFKLSKLTPSLNFAISQTQATPYELSSYFKPISGTGYRNHQNIQQPLKTAKLGYYQGWYWVSEVYSSFQLDYSRNFSSFAYLTNVKNFLDFTTDSIVNVPTYNFNISTSQQIPSLLFNAVFRIIAGYSITSNLIANSGQILTGQNRSVFLNISIRKNWNRKYFIDLKSAINLSNYKLPAVISGSISPRVLNLKNSLIQRLAINKNLNLTGNISVFSNNLFTANNTTFPFIDLEYAIKLKNSPIAITVRGENLTNETFFYRSSNDIYSQSFYSVPLIKRRCFISLKYDL